MGLNAATMELPEEKRCMQCGTALGAAQERAVTPEGTLCRPCFDSRRSGRERDLHEQGRDLNYLMALAGALAGGGVGVLTWWAVTIWSHVAFGLIAILIGIGVGKGATLACGNRRTRGLQILSITVAGASFFYATYLVNRTFIQQALAKEGKEIALALVPNPVLLFRVISLNFDLFDLVFLAIVLWEAWKLTAPVKLPAVPSPAS